MRSDERMPPFDMDAECAVLSSLLLSPEAIGTLHFLRPDHFYSEANQWILRALIDLRLSSTPADILTVRAWLMERRKLEAVGGSAYLAQIIDATPAVAHVEAHAEIIVEKWRARQMISAAQKIAAEGYNVNGTSTKYIAGALQTVKEIADTGLSASPFEWISSKDIMAKLPPIRWVCPDLCIGPGRPTLLSGYGFSGKTIIVLAFDIAVAAHGKVFGEYRCFPGKVMHIDLEQGKYATERRIQRIAFAMGVTEAQFDNRLRLCCFPRTYLTSPGIEDILKRECDGVSVCSIDSFRAAIPGLDENDSAVREPLDMLTRVSESTGCSFIVLHHSGKDHPDRDKRQSMRGSSAIFDACGTVLSLSAKKAYEPILVEAVKVSAATDGRKAQPFYVKLEDISDDEGIDPLAGLRVSHMTSEQVDQPCAPEEGLNKVCDALLAAIRKKPGHTARTLAGIVGARKSDIYAALDMLVTNGHIRQERSGAKGGGNAWYPAEVG